MEKKKRQETSNRQKISWEDFQGKKIENNGKSEEERKREGNAKEAK